MPENVSSEKPRRPNILSEIKGDNLDKNYSIELRDKKENYLGGRDISNIGRIHLDVKLMDKYQDELNYKVNIVDNDISEKQEQLEFTQKFLQTCVVPFPDLDNDKR